MHECAVHAITGYLSCKKNVDHSMKRLLIMQNNIHNHVIMNIIVTPITSLKELKDGNIIVMSSKALNMNVLKVARGKWVKKENIILRLKENGSKYRLGVLVNRTEDQLLLI